MAKKDRRASPHLLVNRKEILHLIGLLCAELGIWLRWEQKKRVK